VTTSLGWLPAPVTRVAQRLGFPLGTFVARETMAARHRHGASDVPPRVLIRVDDYPHWNVPTARFWEFHTRMAERGIPYLLAATPFLSSAPLTPASPPRPHRAEEWEALRAAVARREIEIALHGVTHRTRSSHLASEFDGLALDEAHAAIDEAWRCLVARGCPPVAFVPPFNRLPPTLWDALPRECRVLCLGPESLRDVPLLPSPVSLRERTVVLSLSPFYGRASEIARALRRGHWLERPGAIIPLTLHWTWELADDFAAVAELADLVRERVTRWTELSGT
jgi:hypothetical protein